MKKKLVSLLLCVALLCAALPALADLDAAFEAGALKLTEVNDFAPEFEDFEVTEDMLDVMKELAPDTNFRTMLENAVTGDPLTVLSLAPSGNAAILEVNGYGVCCYKGKYHVIFPGSFRGVEDAYGNMKEYYTALLGKYRKYFDGYTGAVWSPDGRYAAVNSFDILIATRMSMLIDPMVIDTSTGEMILLDTAEITEKSGASVSAACFSRDGRYYYYVLYGRFEEEDTRVCLCRCDLATGKTEQLLKSGEKAYMPPMRELADGSLLVNDNNTTKAQSPGAVFRFAEQGGKWTLEHLECASTARYAGPLRMYYSEKSGNAVLLDGTLLSLPYSFQVVRPEENFAGLDRFLCVAEGKDEVLSLTAQEFEAAVDAGVELHKKIEPAPKYSVCAELPFRCIEYAALSPDGRYLLAETASTEKPGEYSVRELCLIRLSDLAVRKVEGPDAQDIAMGAYYEYSKGIEWNTDTVIIATMDGIKTFRFE